MNPLHAVITSRATAEIVSLLFAMARRSLHVREIARRCGLNEALMRRELRRLARLGLVEARRDGNRLCYRARMTHPLASDLHSMVSKSVGIVEALRMALREPKVDLVIAHGPDVPRITEFGCPIRLLVVGTITRSKTLRLLGLAAVGLGRRIEVDVVSPRDLVVATRPGRRRTTVAPGIRDRYGASTRGGARARSARGEPRYWCVSRGRFSETAVIAYPEYAIAYRQYAKYLSSRFFAGEACVNSRGSDRRRPA